jgi:hypothetical protein
MVGLLVVSPHAAGPQLYEARCGKRLGARADWRACECRIKCELLEPHDCRRAVHPVTTGGCCGRFLRAGRRVLVDTTAARYMAASAVYLMYAMAIMMIDVYAYGGFCALRPLQPRPLAVSRTPLHPRRCSPTPRLPPQTAPCMTASTRA